MYADVHWINSVWMFYGPLCIAIPIIGYRFMVDAASGRSASIACGFGIAMLSIFLFFGAIVVLSWFGFRVGFSG